MLYFLLIVLALLGIWELLTHSGASSATLIAGLRRLALVLAVVGAALGGVIGYFATRSCHTDTSAAQWVTSCSDPNYGAAVLGIAAGFTVIWFAASVIIWIIGGFLAE
jgi:hypothetical protein